jgi:outer membrane murein-binding lipoprotein Lpp
MTGSGLVNTYGLAVPAFASGGAYSGGLALVGEQGPELINFNSGGTVHNARSTASMMNNSNLEAAVEKLNANLEGLRFEVRANVSHAAKTAKILDRAMKDGETLSVSFETAQPVTVV